MLMSSSIMVLFIRVAGILALVHHGCIISRRHQRNVLLKWLVIGRVSDSVPGIVVCHSQALQIVLQTVPDKQCVLLCHRVVQNRPQQLTALRQRHAGMFLQILLGNAGNGRSVVEDFVFWEYHDVQHDEPQRVEQRDARDHGTLITDADHLAVNGKAGVGWREWRWRKSS